MMNFQKLLDQKLENLHRQTRLHRQHLTANLCNLGWCSKTLELYYELWCQLSFGTMFGWFGWWNEAEIARKSKSLWARNWFEIDEELPQKWIGGMKLGPLVYENKWKSKSHTFPFNGTISLKLGSLYKKKLKRLKMKIWPHFHSKKAFSYSRFCKRNIFLMHGFGNMNFLSFSILLGK